MKAVLLAAGLGTRLRPLTLSTPKCLVPIAGKPLLGYWFDLLSAHGVAEVLINTHHLADQVAAFVASYPADLRIEMVFEERLLGSAGTLRANRGWIGDSDFLIAYADNLTNADLTALIDDHRAHESPLTMALFDSPNPSQCGIAALDASGTIREFVEKPREPRGSLANAGIYMASPAILKLIPDRIPADIAHDLLPLLVGRMRGWLMADYLLDVGTPEAYERAQHDVEQIEMPMGRRRTGRGP